jgi:hypothetical protein
MTQAPISARVASGALMWASGKPSCSGTNTDLLLETTGQA